MKGLVKHLSRDTAALVLNQVNMPNFWSRLLTDKENRQSEGLKTAVWENGIKVIGEKVIGERFLPWYIRQGVFHYGSPLTTEKDGSKVRGLPQVRIISSLKEVGTM